jgi:hypothetical protein
MPRPPDSSSSPVLANGHWQSCFVTLYLSAVSYMSSSFLLVGQVHQEYVPAATASSLLLGQFARAGSGAGKVLY